MIKKICILTKSYKHGGYCVAGIDIDSKHWIRLVTSEDVNIDEIKKEQMFYNKEPIECLDIVEVDLLKNIPNICQTENWLINKDFGIKKIGKIELSDIKNIITIDNSDSFIVNNSELLHQNEIKNISRSLFIYCVEDLIIESSMIESFGEIRYKNKCSFKYNGYIYKNMSLTDPVYRDIEKDGLKLPYALIVASLPCVPYGEDLYYKFVAKVFSVNEKLVLNLKSYEGQDIETSPFVKLDLVVRTKQTPGTVVFENYEQIKQKVLNGVSYYENFEYTLENYQIALKHHHELKYVKNILEKTKREIVKNYNKPLEIIERRLEELINFIKKPFKNVDLFIKTNKKNVKKYEIYTYAKQVILDNHLDNYIDNILTSPAFFDEKWLNASCSISVWRKAVRLKIEKANKDIRDILQYNSNNTASLLAHYFQTLSIEKVKNFICSLNEISKIELKIENGNIPLGSAISEQKNTIGGVSKNQQTKNCDFQDYEILEFISKSINPYTGEVLTGIDELLKMKLKEISKTIKTLLPTNMQNNKDFTTYKSDIKETNLEMIGKRWTKEEDERLIDEFNNGLKIKEIAIFHKRKRGGIRARLKKHKLID